MSFFDCLVANFLQKMLVRLTKKFYHDLIVELKANDIESIPINQDPSAIECRKSAPSPRIGWVRTYDW